MNGTIMWCYAVKAGMTMEEIASIKDGPEASIWNEHDRIVLCTVDELVKSSRLTDDTWTTLSRHFDRHQLMDLIITIGNYVMLSSELGARGIRRANRGRDRSNLF
jgi:4-carboxymuconolactone decarboxylase